MNCKNCNKKCLDCFKFCCWNCFISEGTSHNAGCNSDNNILVGSVIINHEHKQHEILCSSYVSKIIIDNKIYNSVDEYIKNNNVSDVKKIKTCMIHKFDQCEQARKELIATNNKKIIISCCNSYADLLMDIRKYYL